MSSPNRRFFFIEFGASTFLNNQASMSNQARMFSFSQA
jgi:hypothetical protein